LATEFSGKTALVTGASRGIGAATALALARAGARRVVVHYNSFQDGADATVAAIRALGADSEAIRAPLGNMAGLRALIAAIDTAAPELEILVNNAGSLVKRAALVDFPEDLYDEVMNLNVKSLWFLTKALVPSMIRRGGGVVVNVSSISARNGGGPGATVYAAAKAAVACMTKGMAKELAPKGIRVNAVSPGTVDNHFHELFSTRQALDSVIAQTPAGTLGTNEEVADTILFLCSDAARYICGQTIEINGGMYMI
jgi:3-oxoacyl-[acyl-carrier protein] reductase